MILSDFHTKDQIDKIGNAIIYLSDNIPNFSKTKVLKLLYIIEEYSIREYGLPFFDIDFKVWKLGPVARDLFIELSSQPVIFNEYIKVVGTADGSYIQKKKDFNDDEFSDLEIDLMDTVIKALKDRNAQELVDITHRKHLPWYITAKQNGLLELFDSGSTNSSDITVDMLILLEDQPEKRDFYLSNLEYRRRSKNFKIQR